MISSIMFGDGADSDSGSGSSSSTACEMCGWIAALGGMLAFGSFGVPIKSKMAKSLDIDPLVMQSYKTTMCFVTSWLFVLLRGEKYTFTPWGIVSGLFWVPGGVATIYAIKKAGLAIGMGVGSSCIVLVSFSWGIFGFNEHVHNRMQACSAVACMLLGLCGMAYFSSPSVAHAASTSSTHGTNSNNNGGSGAYYQPVRPEDPDFLRPDQEEDDVVDREDVSSNEAAAISSPFETDYVAMDDNAGEADSNANDTNNNSNFEEDEDGNLVISVEDVENFEPRQPTRNNGTVLCCCGLMRVQERTLGILAAMVFTGIWGGSILVPMHYAPPLNKGLGYLISFANGAALVNLSLWLFRYLYLCCRYSSMKRGYQALPSFHLRKMWIYGSCCGLLWSIGNFCSILAVEFLGQGVGYSATQAALLVSGLWGINYFHEIEGRETIAKWYGSAMVTVLGILLLSYEHHAN
jgi:glucose uptake protein GlcU